MAPIKVLIIGGGVGGLALASWLGKLGHDVTVVERFPELRAKGQQIDLRAQGVTVARRMGIIEAVRAAGVDEQGVMLVDNKGRRQAFFGANLSGKGRQSLTSEFEIMRGDLCRILHALSKDRPNVKYLFGTTVEALEQNEHADSPVSVRFSDGTEATYDLVVGSDGQNSRTRRMFLGLNKGDEDPTFTFLGMYAAFFAVKSIPSDEHMATVHWAPDRRVLATRVDNPHQTQVYIFAHEEAPAAKELGAALARRDVEAQRKAIIDMFAASPRWQSKRFTDALRTREPEADDFYATELANINSKRWSKGRVALLGDAGYSTATLSGFGTSAALIGAYVLAGEIARHTAGEAAGGAVDLAGALRSYEERLRPLIDERQVMAPWLLRLFLPKSSWAITLLYWACWLISILRIDKLWQQTHSDQIETWNLPDYPELTAKE